MRDPKAGRSDAPDVDLGQVVTAGEVLTGGLPTLLVVQGNVALEPVHGSDWSSSTSRQTQKKISHLL